MTRVRPPHRTRRGRPSPPSDQESSPVPKARRRHTIRKNPTRHGIRPARHFIPRRPGSAKPTFAGGEPSMTQGHEQPYQEPARYDAPSPEAAPTAPTSGAAPVE